MKKAIDAAFFKRNSDKGIKRYLSSLGFDIGRKYEIKPGPTHRLVWVVQADKKAGKRRGGK